MHWRLGGFWALETGIGASRAEILHKHLCCVSSDNGGITVTSNW